MFSSTQIALSSVPAIIISSATTWANTRGASASGPINLHVFNLSTAVSVFLGSSSTAAAGFPLGATAANRFTIVRQGDALFGMTSAGATATIGVLADGQ